MIELQPRRPIENQYVAHIYCSKPVLVTHCEEFHFPREVRIFTSFLGFIFILESYTTTYSIM